MRHGDALERQHAGCTVKVSAQWQQLGAEQRDGGRMIALQLIPCSLQAHNLHHSGGAGRYYAFKTKK